MLFNANAPAVAEKENRAGATNTHAVDSNTANTPTLAEIEWAMQLPMEHCNACGQDRPYSMMAMAGLCDVCAAEYDADCREWEQDRADCMYDLNH